MSVHAPAGWYTDPTGVAPLRWWDGQQWTASTSAAPFATAAATTLSATAPAAASAVAVGAPAVEPAPVQSTGVPPQYQPQPYQAPYQHARPAVGWERNRYAFYTFGIVALYIVIAIASKIVFIGILPLLMSFRSYRAKEQLAPLAIGAAIVAIVIAFASMSGH